MDVRPTMKVRSTDAEFFARLSVLEILFEGIRKFSRGVLGLLAVSCCEPLGLFE